MSRKRLGPAVLTGLSLTMMSLAVLVGCQGDPSPSGEKSAGENAAALLAPDGSATSIDGATAPADPSLRSTGPVAQGSPDASWRTERAHGIPDPAPQPPTSLTVRGIDHQSPYEAELDVLLDGQARSIDVRRSLHGDEAELSLEVREGTHLRFAFEVRSTGDGTRFVERVPGCALKIWRAVDDAGVTTESYIFEGLDEPIPPLVLEYTDIDDPAVRAAFEAWYPVGNPLDFVPEAVAIARLSSGDFLLDAPATAASTGFGDGGSTDEMNDYELLICAAGAFCAAVKCPFGAVWNFACDACAGVNIACAFIRLIEVLSWGGW